MEDFFGRTLVLRVDDESIAGATTLFEDIAFLAARHVRPILIAPNAEGARALVRAMNRSSEMAVGLSGADAGMIPAASEQMLGAIQVRLLTTLTNAGYVPVIEPTALGIAGGDIEVGADEVASAIARATAALRAIFFHESGGVIDAHTAKLIDELTPPRRSRSPSHRAWPRISAPRFARRRKACAAASAPRRSSTAASRTRRSSSC